MGFTVLCPGLKHATVNSSVHWVVCRHHYDMVDFTAGVVKVIDNDPWWVEEVDECMSI